MQAGGFRIRYYTALTALFVLVFYANIPIYFFNTERTGVPPSDWLIALGLTFVPLLGQALGRRQSAHLPVYLWSAFYLVLALVFALAAPGTPEAEAALRQRLLAVLLLLFLVTLLQGDRDAVRVARWSVVCAVLLAVALNVMEFWRPFRFVPLESPYANPGRSAGFYINANQSGAAIVLGAILTVTLLPRRLRLGYLLLALGGVLLTLSRAAIIGWLLVVVVMTAQRTISFRQFAAGVLLALACASVLLPGLVRQRAESVAGAQYGNVLERLEWFRTLGLRQNASQETRVEVVREAWQMFQDRPLTGNGLGRASSLSPGTSTHNLYLTFLMEYGIIGLVVIPWLVLALCWRARRSASQIIVPFGIFILFWCMFSHNVIGEYYFLIGMAVVASLGTAPQTERSHDG